VFCGSIAGCVVLNAKSPSKNCNTLQYIATMYVYIYIIGLLFCQCPLCCAAQSRGLRCWMRTHPQHIATHCNTLQHIATHCNDIFIYFWDLCTCFFRAFVFCGSIAGFVVLDAKSPLKNCNTLQRYVYVYFFEFIDFFFQGPLCFAAQSRGLWCWMRNQAKL